MKWVNLAVDIILPHDYEVPAGGATSVHKEEMGCSGISEPGEAVCSECRGIL